MVTESKVWAALDEVIHPTFGLSLTALQMVQAIRIPPGSIEVDLVMNCPGCPGGEAALFLARAKLKNLIGTGVVKLSLLPQVWQPPWVYIGMQT